ncbi:MAG: type II secretion system protein [Patescibacteria group bacterium]|nr:type II secretion system protein [Patescibacteria group bacterium]
MNKQGFSLSQLIVAVSIMLVLSAAVLLWLDPLARIGVAKDAKRKQDIVVLQAAFSEYARQHQGALPVLGEINSSKKVLCSTVASLTCVEDEEYCLLADDNDFFSRYLPALPVDPDKNSAADSGYYLQKDDNDKLIIGACSSYGEEAINQTTTIAVNCTVYGGGHCWYLADENQTCSNFCQSINKECVSWAKYGPDTNTCLLNIPFSEMPCESCSAASGNNPPWRSDDFSECYYQNNPIDCNQADWAMFNICPCL